MELPDWMWALVGKAAPSAQVTGLSSLSGGYANDLWRVQLDREPFSLVVRAWRRDPGVAATELAVMRLAASAVPVPAILAEALDSDHPAVALQDMPGLPGDVALQQFPEDAKAIERALGETFGRLSHIVFEAGGFFAGPELNVQAFPGSAPEQLLAFARPRIWNEVALQALGDELQAQWWRLVEQEASLLAGLERERNLVHADANPKNVLLEKDASGWRVSAVLDWEFAFSGPSEMDLGNLLRFEDRAGSALTTGILEGWQAAGHEIGDLALTRARLLDVYSLVNFVNTPESALHQDVLNLLRRTVPNGGL